MVCTQETYPTTKASSVVDLCSKIIIFNIDPRFPTFLKPIWSGRLVSKCGRAKACPTQSYNLFGKTTQIQIGFLGTRPAGLSIANVGVIKFTIYSPSMSIWSVSISENPGLTLRAGKFINFMTQCTSCLVQTLSFNSLLLRLLKRGMNSECRGCIPSLLHQ